MIKINAVHLPRPCGARSLIKKIFYKFKTHSAVLSVDKCNRLPRRMQFASLCSDPRKTLHFYLPIMQCSCTSDAVRTPANEVRFVDSGSAKNGVPRFTKIDTTFKP